MARCWRWSARVRWWSSGGCCRRWSPRRPSSSCRRPTPASPAGQRPIGADYDRAVVILNTLRLTGIQLLNDGRQVVCLPGATLDRLEQALAPLDREPHSVIGSSCIGASVLGGVCNNSGRRAGAARPGVHELALVRAGGRAGAVAADQSSRHCARRRSGGNPRPPRQRQIHRVRRLARYSGCASDPDYSTLVREVDAPTPARFNADPRLLHEAAGTAGKLCVFAVRLDTFPSCRPVARLLYRHERPPGADQPPPPHPFRVRDAAGRGRVPRIATPIRWPRNTARTSTC